MLRLTLATLVIVLVLLGPVFVEMIERNVEAFFLVVGVLTACIMGQFNAALVRAALRTLWHSHWQFWFLAPAFAS